MMIVKHEDKFTPVGYKIAKSIVDLINEKGGKARVDITWLDFGQSWAWETILVYSESLDMDYQALSPRDFREMNEGNFSEEKINRIIKDATKDVKGI